MNLNICVYCSASRELDAGITAVASRLGEAIARRGDTLVYGGASVGLMGEIARAVQAGGGRVIGVIPQALIDMEIGYHNADELIITKDMRERKAVMETRADAFIALPGGIGTLDEVFEIMSLRQLKLIDKPLIFFDHDGFYAPVRTLLEHMQTLRMLRADIDSLCHFSFDEGDAFAYIDSIISTSMTSA